MNWRKFSTCAHNKGSFQLPNRYNPFKFPACLRQAGTSYAKAKLMRYAGAVNSNTFHSIY